jgi:hypothetical protein
MRKRLAIAGAIMLAAAGAAIGALLGAGRGIAWVALAASITAVAQLIASFWWEAARERRSPDRQGPVIAASRGSALVRLWTGFKIGLAMMGACVLLGGIALVALISGANLSGGSNPSQPSGPDYSMTCVTPQQVSCLMDEAGWVGSVCTCLSSFGPVVGTVQ